MIREYEKYLINEELSENTITKYLGDVNQLYKYLDKNKLDLDKENLIKYKELLVDKYKTATVNNKITTINKYLDFINEKDLKLKQIRQQQQGLDGTLTLNEYERLLRQAKLKGSPRDVMMLESFYKTGLRVSELEFLTVEAVRAGYIEVDNKGKLRKVPIFKSLEKQLKAYIKADGIESGPIIVNRNGDPLGRSYIFKRMKFLGGQARLKKDKVYPHALRHLFAKEFMEKSENDITTLANILGHESITTTQIYSTLSVNEIVNRIDF